MVSPGHNELKSLVPGKCYLTCVMCNIDGYLGDYSWKLSSDECHRTINIGSGNGLLPDGTKPLPEPMSVTGNHQ